MQKNKLNILLLIGLLTLSLLGLAACKKDNSEAEEEKKQEEIIAKEEKKKEEEKKAEEAAKKAEEEDKKAEEEAKKAEEEAKKAEEEAKKAEEEAKKAEEEAKKAEEERKAQEQEEKEVEDRIPNQVLAFNNRETLKLRNTAKKLGLTQIYKEDFDHPEVKPDDLEAISEFERKNSYGWICRYGDNKIGLAEILHETQVDDQGNTYNPPQIVVQLWEENMIFEPTGVSGITNNNPEDFKKAAKEIEKLFFEDGDTVKHLF